METKKRNFVESPSKKHIILFTSLWLLGIVLLVLSTTDLFTETFFQNKYAMIHLLMLGSTFAMGKFHLNYWTYKRVDAHLKLREKK